MTPHFSRTELAGDLPLSVSETANLSRLAVELEMIRRICGDHPIRITSGIRSADRNAAVGGVSNSAHLNGLAADFVVDGLSVEAAFDLIFKGRAFLVFDQLIEYESHIHIGLRNKPRSMVLTRPG